MSQSSCLHENLITALTMGNEAEVCVCMEFWYILFIRIKVHTDSETVMQDQTVDQQVYRVEQVEEVFEGDSPFPVVQVDRDEGQAGGGFPQEAQAGNQGTEKFLIMEQVE